MPRSYTNGRYVEVAGRTVVVSLRLSPGELRRVREAAENVVVTGPTWRRNGLEQREFFRLAVRRLCESVDHGDCPSVDARNLDALFGVNTVGEVDGMS